MRSTTWDRARARIIPPLRMARTMDNVIAGLTRRLDTEPEQALRRGMHYPTTWDPLFTSYMTIADIYRYPTRHFRHHQRQLTLAGGPVTDNPGEGKGKGTRGRAGRPAGTALTPRQARRFYGTNPLPVAGGEFGPFVAVYVIDLLSPDGARTVVAQARRVLPSEGPAVPPGDSPPRSLSRPPRKQREDP